MTPTTRPPRRTIHPTEEFIDAARALMQPAKVELHELPRWVRPAVKAVRDRRGVPASACNLQQLAWYPPRIIELATGLDLSGLFDHWGRCGDALVCEPYGVGSDIAGKAIKLAEVLGCDVWFTSNSWWYPGHTTRIEFKPKQEIDQ